MNMNEEKKLDGVDQTGASDAPDLKGSGKERSELPLPGKAGASEASEAQNLPDPEVSPKAKRRRLSASYKLRIVQEANACTESGQIGALLRREGLWSSQLAKWRRLYESGALKALADDSRGRPSTRNAKDDEIARLRKENERLAQQLKRTEAIVEIQKKLSALLAQSEENDK